MKRVLSALLCLVLLASVCLSAAACGAIPASPAEVTAAAVAKAVPSTTAKTAPGPTAAAAPDTPPQPLKMGSYSCDEFSIAVPEGWTTDYQVYDAGDGLSRIVICVSDAQDPNNRIFYASAIEPFFDSLDIKNAYLPHLDNYYEWSPVLSQYSAEGTLRQWAAIFTLMQAEGLGFDSYFRNYLIEDVFATADAAGSGNGFVRSGVLARVSIPAAEQNYAMYFENSLVRSPAPAGMPEDDVYYISYDNMGIVVGEAQYDIWFPQLAECLRSINLYSFGGQHDILSQNGRLSVELPVGVPLK